MDTLVFGLLLYTIMRVLYNRIPYDEQQLIRHFPRAASPFWKTVDRTYPIMSAIGILACVVGFIKLAYTLTI